MAVIHYYLNERGDDISMKKWELSIRKNIYQMAMSNNQQYLYFSRDQLTVYDLYAHKTIQQIPQTKNGWFTLSRDGDKLCLIQPIADDKTQVIIYLVTPTLSEITNIVLDNAFRDCYPEFSEDEQFVVFPTRSKLYMVNVKRGEYKVLLSLDKSWLYISSVDLNATSIICAVHSSSDCFDGIGIYVFNKCGVQTHYIPFENPRKIFHTLFKARLTKGNRIMLLYKLSHYKTGIQYISDFSINSLPISFDEQVLPLSISQISFTDSRNHIAFVGSIVDCQKISKVVCVYRMSDMSLVYKEYFDPYLWSAQFCKGSDLLLISGEKQHFLQI